MGLMALLFVCIFVPLFRLSTYATLYRAPISILGRICTGRWIIPGYDVCSVGPFLSLVGAIAVYALTPREISPSLAITTSLLLALITPPGLAQWRLTGKHRIVAVDLAQRQNVRLVQVP